MPDWKLVPVAIVAPTGVRETILSSIVVYACTAEFAATSLSRATRKLSATTRAGLVTLNAFVVVKPRSCVVRDMDGLSRFCAEDAGWPSVGLVGLLTINSGIPDALLGGDNDPLRVLPARYHRSDREVAGADGLPQDDVGRAWKPAKSVAWLSPFR